MNQNTSIPCLNAPSVELTDIIVEMRGISKVFHTDDIDTHALCDVNFTIFRGEYISVSGPSGCGKSTLLSLLGLLDSPSSGEYELLGCPVADINRKDRAKLRNREIGFIFQSFNLVGDLSVFENVELPLIYRGVKKSERRELAMDALRQMEMSHRAMHLPAQLSGGQQQRVAVARAIVGAPKILLADEPTGNLDSKNGECVMQILEQLNQNGSTICMVTHDERYAHSAQREIRLFDGKIANQE
jgi:putative ABC transport system ATP-binding protein